MRVAILTNRLPPTLDGVGDYSNHLANELQRNGHDVSVICKRESAIQQAVKNGRFDVPVSATIPEWNWLAIRPLLQFFAYHKPEWLLVQYVPNSFQRWAMPIWLPILLWLAKRKGIRISITFHEVYIRLAYWPVKYWFVAIVQRLVCSMLTRLATVLITSIDIYADMLNRHTDKPIHLIPIPSNILPIPVTNAELMQLRQTRIAPNAEPVLCTFGLRNQDMILRVLDKIVNTHPTVRLLICGRLNLATTQTIYNRLKDRILVTGFMNAPDVYRHLRASDVFILPDLVNKFGQGGTCNKSTALAAALAAGLPVVGTKGDMNNALLQRTPGLSLHHCQSESSIAESLLKQISNTDNPTLRAEIMAFSEANLNWRVVALKQLKIFDSFIPTR